jgi:catechol 2,3-dioxygenase-like lactoylglutathione lyase family enzyme
MIETLDALVSSYEHGTLTRRQLLNALAVVGTRPVVREQSDSGAVARGRVLHHVNVQVSDVARSEAFYRKLLGCGPSRRVQGPDNHGLDLAGSGAIILQKSETPGRIDHFCVGVDRFDADRMRAAARAAGFDRVQGTATDNFFVADPDGLRVQLSAVDWSA